MYYLYVVAIDGDYEKTGEYDGINYETLDQARKALHIAEEDETIDVRILER